MTESHPLNLPPTSPRLEDQLCFDLYVAARAMTTAYRPLLDTLDLTYPQYLVMLALWQHGPHIVKALSERLQLDSGTLSPLLKRLEAHGYLSRSRRLDDERELEIALTAQGDELRARALTVSVAMREQIGLDSEAICSLQDELRGLAGRLKRRA